MNANEPLLYSEEEIRSFLPSGWYLADGGSGAAAAAGAAGTWDAKKRTWQVRVVDNVDFDWPVVVKADEVAMLGDAGRIEALRRAMNKVYRERLG
jgi:hypothetical protein